jgi:hypothetical protein
MHARLLVSVVLCCICLFLSSTGSAAAASQGCSLSTAAASASSQGGLVASIPRDLVLSIEAIKLADGGRCAAASATPETAHCSTECRSKFIGNLFCVTCCSCCFFDVGDPICECSSDCIAVF